VSERDVEPTEKERIFEYKEKGTYIECMDMQ
jgi:hypothetical protein